MRNEPRFVFDTNVLVSAVLFSRSKPRLAWNLARRKGVVLVSAEAEAELRAVLDRPKFEAYVARPEIELFLREFSEQTRHVMITERIALCRDPKDDKFLELAAAGAADWLVTGDRDLLALDPFRGTAIVSPADLLDRLR